MTAAPDLAEPVAGWRIWNVLDGDHGPELVSPVRPTSWAHRTPTTATCSAGCESCPSEGCRCGLYALPEIGRLLLAPDEAALVLGCVALWGRVVEHAAGWRGEHGYPLVLFVVAGQGFEAGRGTYIRRVARFAFPESDDFRDDFRDVPDDGNSIEGLSRELARRYAVPVHPAPELLNAAVLGRMWASSSAADAVLAEAVTGLARRRDGDPEARARLDRRVQDLIGSGEI